MGRRSLLHSPSTTHAHGHWDLQGLHLARLQDAADARCQDLATQGPQLATHSLRRQTGPCSCHQERCLQRLKVRSSLSWRRGGGTRLAPETPAALSYCSPEWAPCEGQGMLCPPASPTPGVAREAEASLPHCPPTPAPRVGPPPSWLVQPLSFSQG